MSFFVEEIRKRAASRLYLYRDVEELINPGFLSASVVAAGVCLSMKTLCPGELAVLRARLNGVQRDRFWRAWVVSSSVWVIDGQVLLGDVNAAVKVYGVIKDLPVHAVDLLFETFTALHNRVRVGMSRLEAYCYEEHSRASWRMIGRDTPSREGVCEIPGAARWGMSNTQKLWVAFNQSEDDKQLWNTSWSSAKLVASAHSAGIKKLYQKDDTDRKLEDERRASVIEEMVREATGNSSTDGQARMTYKAVTREELEEEMARWVRGEKDHHDEVVEAYKNRIRQAMAPPPVEPHRIEEPSEELMFITPEQAAALNKNSSSTVYNTPLEHHLYDRYLSKEEFVGSVDDRGKAVPLPDPQPKKSLSEDVLNRRPTLRSS